jgi:hypothetical protein
VPAYPGSKGGTALQIPAHLMKDRYWKGTLHLFTNHSKLQRYLVPEHFNFEENTVNAKKLKQVAKPWSQSERFMLDLALHLYNEQHKVNLSDMDYLDSSNKGLAFEALRLRFG